MQHAWNKEMVSNIITLRYNIYIYISVRSIPCDIIQSSVWLKQWTVMFCLAPKEFIRPVNPSPIASFLLSTWMLKSPAISALPTLSNRSANYLRKSVYDPGGLYTVDIDLLCIYVPGGLYTVDLGSWPRWCRVRTQRQLRVLKTVFMSVSLVSSSSNCLTFIGYH